MSTRWSTSLLIVFSTVIALTVWSVEPHGVVIERPEHDGLRIFHVRVLLASQDSLLYDLPHLRDELTPLGRAVAKEIDALPGVASGMNIGRYYFTVRKGDAFTWQEIEARVLEVLDRLLNTKPKKKQPKT